MKHQLRQEQILNTSIDIVWDFFTDAKNLKQLTPENMNMRVVSDLDNTRIFEGMKISYYVSPLFKIPVFWQTEIIKVDEKKQFIDIQKKGPFKLWKHTHSFESIQNGVKMIDEVEYELPFGQLGNIFHKPLVLKNLQELFEFRSKICNQIFNSK